MPQSESKPKPKFFLQSAPRKYIFGSQFFFGMAHHQIMRRREGKQKVCGESERLPANSLFARTNLVIFFCRGLSRSQSPRPSLSRSQSRSQRGRSRSLSLSRSRGPSQSLSRSPSRSRRSPSRSRSQSLSLSHSHGRSRSQSLSLSRRSQRQKKSGRFFGPPTLGEKRRIQTKRPAMFS
jgi:hypothetical protein